MCGNSFGSDSVVSAFGRNLNLLYLSLPPPRSLLHFSDHVSHFSMPWTLLPYLEHVWEQALFTTGCTSAFSAGDCPPLVLCMVVSRHYRVTSQEAPHSVIHPLHPDFPSSSSLLCFLPPSLLSPSHPVPSRPTRCPSLAAPSAYLLGCPVRGVVLDAFDAMRSGINGLVRHTGREGDRGETERE